MAIWRGSNLPNSYDFQTDPLSGNDEGYGRGGNDKIWGYYGNDKLYGENGNDWVYGEYGNDHVYGGKGNDRVYGGPGNDRVYGGPSNDRVYGGPGHDWLYGDEGKDSYYGGAGRDRYYFDWKDTSESLNTADYIYDFKEDDAIYLKGEYELSEDGSMPGGGEPEPDDGEYALWQEEDEDWIIKYNAHDNDEVYHYIVVRGEDPTGHILDWIV